MPIADNFSSEFSQNWEINFLQCYPNGFLKQTELCNLLQLTAGEHAERGGMSFTDMQQYNQAWVLSRMRVEIDQLPKWRDTVTVKTWIKTLEGSRSVRCLEMWCNDKKIVGSETYWAVINTKLRRPEHLMLPHNHFKKFTDKNATQKPVSKILVDRDFPEIFTRKVVLSDLDIVFHANNVKYLEWCLDNIDYKPLLNQQLKSFDMNFMRELKLNDEIILKKGRQNNQEYFVVSNDSKACFALELNWNSK